MFLDKRKNPTDRRSRIKEVRPSSVDQHRRIWHLVLLNRLPGFTGPFPPPLLIRHICKCYFSVPRSDSFDIIAEVSLVVKTIFLFFMIFFSALQFVFFCYCNTQIQGSSFPRYSQHRHIAQFFISGFCDPQDPNVPVYSSVSSFCYAATQVQRI